METAECKENLIGYLKGLGRPVEKGTNEYELLRRELSKIGKNIEEYGCLASEQAYLELIELLPEEERERQRKVLEDLKN
ncbi:MAG: hypothetical protein QXU82_02555 [Candidatus Aenigmatarchaeota archaeon]